MARAGDERIFARNELHLARRELDQPVARGRRGRLELIARVERVERAELRAEIADLKWAGLSAPIEAQRRDELADARTIVDDLNLQQQHRLDWLRQHPAAAQRLEHLERSVQPELDRTIAINEPRRTPRRAPERDLGIGLGL